MINEMTLEYRVKRRQDLVTNGCSEKIVRQMEGEETSRTTKKVVYF